MATPETKMQYKNLGDSGLRISKVVLGTMSYGSSTWQGWVLDEQQSLPLLKHAFDSGINTWDTADTYSNGKSERLIGKAIKTYNIPRSQLVLMTKCYFGVDDEEDNPRNDSLMISKDGSMANRTGLSRKHIVDAVEKSVERLGTYIDVLQIHRLDRGTPTKEIMRALNDVIGKGWVRYIGASSMACWEFQNLQNVAKENGYHQFISMQNFYNLLYREEEREMIPYCNFSGVGIIPWSPIARGVLARPWGDRGTGREEHDKSIAALIRSRTTETDKVIVDRIEEVARKHGVPMARVAAAWTIKKGCCPIMGLNSKERIDEAVSTVGWELPDDDTEYLENAYIPKSVVGH